MQFHRWQQITKEKGHGRHGAHSSREAGFTGAVTEKGHGLSSVTLPATSSQVKPFIGLAVTVDSLTEAAFLFLAVPHLAWALLLL